MIPRARLNGNAGRKGLTSNKTRNYIENGKAAMGSSELMLNSRANWESRKQPYVKPLIVTASASSAGIEPLEKPCQDPASNSVYHL